MRLFGLDTYRDEKVWMGSCLDWMIGQVFNIAFLNIVESSNLMLPDETMPLGTIGSPSSVAIAVCPQPSLVTAVSQHTSWVMSVCLHFYLLGIFSGPLLFPRSTCAKVVSRQASRVSGRFFSGAKVCRHPFAVRSLCHHSASEVANLSQKPSSEGTIADPSILDCQHSAKMTRGFQDSLNTGNIRGIEIKIQQIQQLIYILQKNIRLLKTHSEYVPQMYLGLLGPWLLLPFG